MRQRQWVRTAIAEPFPVLYGHVNVGSPGPGESQGPHYAPNSEWFELVRGPKTLVWKQAAADSLRAKGYTVSVEIVTR